MSTYRERRMQRAKTVLKNLSPSEINEFRKYVRTYEPEKSTGDCGFLNLPAEIRNIIYHYVASDAHASAVAPEFRFGAAYCDAVRGVRDGNGQKIRPGLLGTCREVFREFHSIFYSPTFIKAKLCLNHSDWQTVTNSAMLDAIVNDKHDMEGCYRGTSQAEFESIFARSFKGERNLQGYREMVAVDGSAVFISFPIFFASPWVDRYGPTVGEWSMTHSCHDLAKSTGVPEKKDRCALCLVSMGPERAASTETRYRKLA